MEQKMQEGVRHTKPLMEGIGVMQYAGMKCCLCVQPGYMKWSEETIERYVGLMSGLGALVLIYFIHDS